MATEIQRDSGAHALPQFEKMQARDVYDVIVTVVAPIFLIIAVALVIHYVAVPIGPMIPLTPNFSMSLHLLVCTGVGVVMTFLVGIQLIRPKDTAAAFERFFNQVKNTSNRFKGWIKNNHLSSTPKNVIR
ncbi:MAG: hypothetical protein S4CHLAM123_03900 [Chlamydiales bacterium]|nr:hypothetical protein [Chlamydiales bacterium]